MKWSKNIPQNDGYYWWRKTKNHSEPLWLVIFVEKWNGNDDEWIYWEDGTEIKRPVGGWWAGPLPKPIG